MEKSDEEKSQIAKAAIRTRTLNALKINILEIKEMLINKKILFHEIPKVYDYIYFHNETKPIIILYTASVDECILHVGANTRVFSYSELEKNKLSEYIKKIL